MVIKRILLCACASLLSALTFLPAAQAEVTQDEEGRVELVNRDASGRVQSRTVLEADGARHTTATEYWPKSKVAKRTVEEDLDPAGHPTSRVVSAFDSRGRVLERRAVSIDAAGRERGTRTHFAYDAQGRVRKSTSPIAH
jgi:YD repeat-containing protein